MSSGVLSPGFIRRGVGVWKRTFATATHRGDRLAHTTLILGGLPCFALPTRGVGAALNSGADDATPLLPHDAAVTRGEPTEN